MADWARRRARSLAAGACGGGAASLAALLAGRPEVALVLWVGVVLACIGLVGGATAEYAAARRAAVHGLARVLAAKDPYTGEHTARVARYSVYIGEELGLSPRRLSRLRHAALLHDVGKLAVPAALLNKPGRLTDEEFRRVQDHAHACDDILGRIDALRPLAAAASGHHRRFDGGGYGAGTRAGERSLHATVVAVADAYDAMTSTRAYRRALPQATAFEELRHRAGTQFDPAAVAALIAAIERRGERHGLGFESSAVVFDVEPPRLGVGSAGLAHRTVLSSLRDRGARR